MSLNTQGVRSLDQALLFLSSFLSFGFASMLQLVQQTNFSKLLLLVPALLVSVALPLYVGYMRGSIEQPDSLLERARGWVYLIFGTGSYGLTLVLVPFAYTPNHTPVDVAVIIFGAWFLLAFFTYRFVRWLYKVASFELIKTREKIGISATISANLAAMFGLESVVAVIIGKAIYINNAPFVYDEFTASAVSLYFASIVLYFFFLLEFNCHHYLGIAEVTYMRLKKRFPPRKDKNPPTYAIITYDFILMTIAVLLCSVSRPRWVIWPMVTMLGITIGSMIVSYYNILGEAVMAISAFFLYLSLVIAFKRAYSREGKAGRSH